MRESVRECERERKRVREKDKERERERQRQSVRLTTVSLIRVVSTVVFSVTAEI